MNKVQQRHYDKINKFLEQLETKFQDKKKTTIISLQKQLAEERNLYKAELSKLASQKMTEYLELKDNKQ